MPTIYLVANDETLANYYKDYSQASIKVFEGSDHERFKAIKRAQKYSILVTERIRSIINSLYSGIVEDSFIENNINSPNILLELSSFMKSKKDLELYLHKYSKKIGSDLLNLYKELLGKAKEDDYILFWVIDEGDSDALL